jgi:TonB family protein
MPLPHQRLVAALALAALFVGCETAAPENITLQPVANAPRLKAAASGPITKSPVPRVQTVPQYPSQLRHAGVQGEAVVEFLVMPDGKVGEIAVIRATDVRFGDAAVECVKGWRFEPAMSNDTPVACHLQVPIEFSLENAAHPASSAGGT